MSLPRVMVAAPSSGSGKTLVTCGLLQALASRGMDVASFKCGPDYIDPMFHSRVIGTRSKNLDAFFADPPTLRYIFGRTAEKCQISVVEGVMGFYDGLSFTTEASSWDVARTLDAPVVLLIDSKGASLSAVATLKGFLEFRESNIRGVIFNRMSERVFDAVAPRVRELGVEPLGYVPRVDDLVLESRHLGLVLPGEVEALREKLSALAEVLERTVDIENLIGIAGSAPDLEYSAPAVGRVEPKVRIGLAEDDAFCFTYEDNVELLKRCGAEIVRFSPLRDPALPDVDGIVLSGGYPELHGAELESNRPMLEDVRRKVAGGMPCMAECGGFMYLHETMEDSDGVVRRMAGAIPGGCRNTGKLCRFGYVKLSPRRDGIVPAGSVVRGHEFHYWDSDSNGSDWTASKGGSEYGCIHDDGRMLAGYPHFYLYSNPDAALGFVKRCAEYRDSRRGRGSGPVLDLGRLPAPEPAHPIQHLVQDVPAPLRPHDAPAHEVQMAAPRHAHLDVAGRRVARPPLERREAVGEDELGVAPGRAQRVRVAVGFEERRDLRLILGVAQDHAPRRHPEPPVEPHQEWPRGGRVRLDGHALGVEVLRRAVEVHQDPVHGSRLRVHVRERRRRVRPRRLRHLRHEGPRRVVPDGRPHGRAERRDPEHPLHGLRGPAAELRPHHHVEPRGAARPHVVGRRPARDEPGLQAHERQQPRDLRRPGPPAGVLYPVPQDVHLLRAPVPGRALQDLGDDRVEPFGEGQRRQVDVHHDRVPPRPPREAGVVGAQERSAQRVHEHRAPAGAFGDGGDALGHLRAGAEHEVVVVQERARELRLPAKVLRRAPRRVLALVIRQELMQHRLRPGAAPPGAVDHRVREPHGLGRDDRAQQAVRTVPHSPASQSPGGTLRQSATSFAHLTAPPTPRSLEASGAQRRPVLPTLSGSLVTTTSKSMESRSRRHPSLTGTSP